MWFLYYNLYSQPDQKFIQHLLGDSTIITFASEFLKQIQKKVHSQKKWNFEWNCGIYTCISRCGLSRGIFNCRVQQRRKLSTLIMVSFSFSLYIKEKICSLRVSVFKCRILCKCYCIKRKLVFAFTMLQSSEVATYKHINCIQASI